MPWAVSSILGDDKLSFRPKHNIYAFFMILYGLFDLILLFVFQICHVNCETENWKYKKFIFKKNNMQVSSIQSDNHNRKQPGPM